MSTRDIPGIRPSKRTPGKWDCDYVDGAGTPHRKTFKTQKDAIKWRADTMVKVRSGTFIAESETLTIAEGAAVWIEDCGARKLEPTHVQNCKIHVDKHIVPFVGREKMSTFRVRSVRDFQKMLREAGRSDNLIRTVTVSLGSIFADAQECEKVAHNPVRDMHRARKGKKDGTASRHKRKLVVGRDIPSREEMRALNGVLVTPEFSRARPLMLTQAFAGLRISEVRGLTWADVDFAANRIHINQRADRNLKIGSPKSKDSARSVPMPPKLAALLKEWKLAYPRPVTGRDGEGKPIRAPHAPHHLVFGNGVGKVESYTNIERRLYSPAFIAAGLIAPRMEDGKPVIDDAGEPVVEAKFATHALRHFYASWCINTPAKGGLGLPPKEVQYRLGHATLAQTMDTYAHLWERGEDGSEMAEAESALFA